MRAAPITRVIAARVVALRGEMSGAKLAARLNEYGVPWNRNTVAKFETGRRESISVQELLALALALGTTPLSLLTDPRIDQAIPLGEGFEVDPWIVALWARGDGHNDERDPRLQVDRTTWVLFDLAHSIADLCRRMRRPVENGHDLDARDRSLIRLLGGNLDQAKRLGAAAYPVPGDVRARADELGVPLDRDEPWPGFGEDGWPLSKPLEG